MSFVDFSTIELAGVSSCSHAAGELLYKSLPPLLVFVGVGKISQTAGVGLDVEQFPFGSFVDCQVKETTHIGILPMIHQVA